MPTGLVASSDTAAEQAAGQAIADGGNAIDAVIAGFLGAAGARDGVLLSPVVAMVAGVGVASRWFDGRCCQPGAEVPRPRGFVAETTIPVAARAAAPRSLGMLALLHAYGAARPMRALCAPAVAIASKAAAPARSEVLDAFGRNGSMTLASGHVARALLRAAGQANGGLLTEADLASARPADAPLAFDTINSGELALPLSSEPAASTPPREAEVLVAADPRGIVSAIAFSPDDEGLLVPELQLRLPRDAEPVQRGVARVTPRAPRPAPCPIAVLRRPDGWYAALGAAGRNPIDATALDSADGDAFTLSSQLQRLVTALDARSAWAASVQRQRPQITHAAPLS